MFGLKTILLPSASSSENVIQFLNVYFDFVWILLLNFQQNSFVNQPIVIFHYKLLWIMYFPLYYSDLIIHGPLLNAKPKSADF